MIYYFVREQINNNTINMQFVFIDKQITNNFIKTLYLDKFVIFRNVLKIKAASKHSMKIKD